MSAPTAQRPAPPGPPPPRPALPLRLLSRVVGLIVVTVVLVLPGVWQWRNAEDRADARAHNIVEQVTTVQAPPSDPALVERLRTAGGSAQAAPIILTYHNISDLDGPYTVSPAMFAAQMRLLADAGWTTISADQLAGWLAGRPLPPHSVMVTFDDGARGVWQYADPILARYHQRATAYIITGFVGTSPPYYMTWPEITALHASGRWDIQAHTHLGHGEVVVDQAGRRGPFLTSPRYLPDQARPETLAEYRARILADLTECKRQLASHGLGDAQFFAYPFSAHAGTPETSAALAEVVHSLFRAAMLDEAGDAVATTSTDLAEGNLARMDITSDVTLPTWVDRVLATNPRDPATAAPFAHPQDWASSEHVPIPLPIQGARVALDPGPGKYLELDFAPTATTMWRTYQLSAALGGFRGVDDGATAGLIVLAGDPNEIEVTLNDGSYQVRQGPGASQRTLNEGPLPPAAGYPVEITVQPGAVRVTIAGRPLPPIPLTPVGGRAPAGGIAITANRYDETSPVPAVADLTTH